MDRRPKRSSAARTRVSTPLELGVQRPPGVAGGHARLARDVYIRVDVALGDAGVEEVAALGIRVHTGPVGVMTLAGADVAVGGHGVSLPGLDLGRGSTIPFPPPSHKA